MSVSTTISKRQYNGNGSSTDFTADFLFLADTDLIVTETVIATGVSIVDELTTDYTVSGAGVGTGTVTMNSAPASTIRLTIQRSTPSTQTTDLVADDAFNPDTVELALDKLRISIQEIQEQVNRCVQYPVTDSSPTAELDNAVDRADTVFSFDADGNPSLTASADASATAAAASATAAASSASDAADSAAAAAASAGSVDLPASPSTGDILYFNSSWLSLANVNGSFLVGGASVPAYKNASDSRTALGLGTSAVLDVGTTASKVVQLDGSAKLPAVDGSQLTNLPSASSLPAGFTSSGQTITAGGSLSVAHGLGSAPVLIAARLKCTSADLNYSVNDEVQIAVDQMDGTSLGNYGMSVIVSDSTNLGVRFATTTGVFRLCDKTSGAPATIDASKWVLILKAWK